MDLHFKSITPICNYLKELLIKRNILAFQMCQILLSGGARRLFYRSHSRSLTQGGRVRDRLSCRHHAPVVPPADWVPAVSMHQLQMNCSPVMPWLHRKSGGQWRGEKSAGRTCYGGDRVVFYALLNRRKTLRSWKVSTNTIGHSKLWEVKMHAITVCSTFESFHSKNKFPNDWIKFMYFHKKMHGMHCKAV